MMVFLFVLPALLFDVYGTLEAPIVVAKKVFTNLHNESGYSGIPKRSPARLLILEYFSFQHTLL